VRFAVFCDITQRKVAIPYRLFGAVYRSEVQKVFVDFSTIEDGTDRLSRNVGTVLPLYAV